MTGYFGKGGYIFLNLITSFFIVEITYKNDLYKANSYKGLFLGHVEGVSSLIHEIYSSHNLIYEEFIKTTVLIVVIEQKSFLRMEDWNQWASHK